MGLPGPVVGVNDLASQYPTVAAQWHPTLNGDLTPEQVCFSRNIKAWWQCSVADDHAWDASPNARIRRTGIMGCPFCSGRRLLPGYNDLATRHPEIAAQWHPTLNGDLTPGQVSPNRNAKVWWVCPLTDAHVWDSTPNNRVNGNQGCPFCSGKRILPGYNDLSTRHPGIAAQWHPTLNGDLTPDQVAPMSHRKVWWQCPLFDHAWQMQVSKRTTRGQGCSVCAGRTVLPGFNDLASKAPEASRSWHPTRNGTLTPRDVTVASDKRVWWLCPKCGFEWEGHVYAKGGCPGCEQYSSVAEEEVAQAVRALLPDVVVERKRRCVLSDRRAELDIWIPSMRIAIEYNGIFWHSESTGHGPRSHLAKLEKCRDAGIRLIVVWEDHWRQRRDAVISHLAHELGARHRLPDVLGRAVAEPVPTEHLLLRDASADAARAFFEEHHVSGGAPRTHTFTLSEPDNSVVRAALALGASRRKGEWEIARYATDGSIPGGFGRLLGHAERTLMAEGVSLDRWIAFATGALSDGRLHERAGFIVDTQLPADYMYAGPLTRWQRIPKESLEKNRSSAHPRLAFDPGLSEEERAAANDLRRVWDYGKTRYIKEIRSCAAPRGQW